MKLLWIPITLEVLKRASFFVKTRPAGAGFIRADIGRAETTSDSELCTKTGRIVHSHKEMAHINEVLPGLYAEQKDKPISEGEELELIS